MPPKKLLYNFALFFISSGMGAISAMETSQVYGVTSAVTSVAPKIVALASDASSLLTADQRRVFSDIMQRTPCLELPVSTRHYDVCQRNDIRLLLSHPGLTAGEKACLQARVKIPDDAFIAPDLLPDFTIKNFDAMQDNQQMFLDHLLLDPKLHEVIKAASRSICATSKAPITSPVLAATTSGTSHAFTSGTQAAVPIAKDTIAGLPQEEFDQLPGILRAWIKARQRDESQHRPFPDLNYNKSMRDKISAWLQNYPKLTDFVHAHVIWPDAATAATSDALTDAQ